MVESDNTAAHPGGKLSASPALDPEITVKVSDVSVAVGDAQLLENVTFDCRAGEWTLIYGPTGSGKSTLLRAINGLRPLTRGYISTLGTRIPGRSGREARTVWRKTGTVLQEVALFETKTALENVALVLRTTGLDGQSARDRATNWLDHLSLGKKVQEYPCRLSGGERQRVALARAFAVQPRLLLLDEPTSALDKATAKIVLVTVKELVERGATVLMSSHRMDEIAEVCDQQIGLRDGQLSAIERRPRAGKRIAAGEPIAEERSGSALPTSRGTERLVPSHAWWNRFQRLRVLGKKGEEAR
jgi:ABC-type polar amino acid transport system ATPase subunit